MKLPMRSSSLSGFTPFPNLTLLERKSWSIASKTRNSSSLRIGGDKFFCPFIPGGDRTGERARNAKTKKMKVSGQYSEFHTCSKRDAIKRTIGSYQ